MEPFVQPIIVDSSANHEDTLLAAVRSSLTARPPDWVESHEWNSWLSGVFTKSVRKLKPKDFDKLLTEDNAGLDKSFVEYGSARAVSFKPMSYRDFPKFARRAQVQNLDFPKDIRISKAFDVYEDAHPVKLVVNNDLNMETGKLAAQVSHGYWMKFLKDEENTPAVFPIPKIFYVNELSFNALLPHCESVVRDSGKTVFNEPTNTVLVL